MIPPEEFAGLQAGGIFISLKTIRVGVPIDQSDGSSFWVVNWNDNCTFGLVIAQAITKSRNLRNISRLPIFYALINRIMPQSNVPRPSVMRIRPMNRATISSSDKLTGLLSRLC